ncbi:MAG: AbrB/MazE/SpoVT family DNA-binding domain-containing protein [Chloracidobacterium sp.]|nr:AbrB/MazE/SpoVT family DNA-binding domain-containing protein [Chloracidobacterium sp.]
MKYESTITSKGTITIAAPIREALGLTPGRKVRLSLMKDRRILLEPAISVDEFIKFRDEVLSKLPETPRLSQAEIDAAKLKAKSQEYRRRNKPSDQPRHKRRSTPSVR